MKEFHDQALRDFKHTVHEFQETLSLNFPNYATEVGLEKQKKCLDGTRIEVLKEVVDWMDDTDAAAPRVFWLHGQAGKGKSAIAQTIARHAENLGMLGSCFRFTRVGQHERLHTKLPQTIARDLAKCDFCLRLLLAEVTIMLPDIGRQWKKLIFEPLSKLANSSTGNILVIIDALDESGTKETRSAILEVLAGHDATLPANLRLLLTSRPLVDIQVALDASQHIRAMSLDDIDPESTIADIRRYVTNRLKSLSDVVSDEHLQQLAVKSGGVFEWANLACDFISRHPIKSIAKERLEKILSHDAWEGKTLLDEMYTTLLKQVTRGDADVLALFRSVMRLVLWLKEPLPISALDFLRDRFPQWKYGGRSVKGMLNLMAPLLSGTRDTSTPIRPLHASFYDFLMDQERSGEFFVDEGDVHRDLALASISVMQAGLECDIWRPEMADLEVVDLDQRIEQSIPPHRLYACQFWVTHLQDAGLYTRAETSRGLVAEDQLLFWLGALGVCEVIKPAGPFSIPIEQRQVRTL